MFLPELSIRRPVMATVIVLCLLIFGLIGMRRLGILLFPNVKLPVISISTIWPNARPDEIDNNVTDELEDSLGGIEGIKHITSESYEGLSRVMVEFELFKDVDVASEEVRGKVFNIINKLPEDAESPMIEKIDMNANPRLWIAFFGQRPIEELTDYADRTIKPFFQKLQGVGDIWIFGQKRKVRIWLNRDRLAQYGLGIDEVVQAIKAQHIEIPGGKVESSSKEFLIRTLGEFPTEEAFNDLIIAYREGNPIRIRNLGNVEAGREDFTSETRYSPDKKAVMKAVSIGIVPRSGANEVEMARLVKKEIKNIQAMLPAGMVMEIASDDSAFVESSINEVKFQLILGGIAAALVVLLFLQNIRTTIFTSIAIPTSIISTFAVIYAFGFTINNLTMLALITAVGLVIDDSIIMEENIYRHRFELNKTSLQAALDGSREIGFAVVASTLVLAGAFLPVAFMGGIAGLYFKEFALTMAFAVGWSMFVALTVEPMLASRFLKPGGERWMIFRTFDALMVRLKAFYRRLIGWVLDHNRVVLLFILAALLGGAVFLKFIKKEFLTSEDKSQFSISIENPLSYSIYKTDGVVRQVEKIIRAIPEVKNYWAMSGVSASFVPDASKGQIHVNLVSKNERKKSQLDLMAEVREKIKNFPDTTALVSELSLAGMGTRGEPIQLVIQGPNLEGLDSYSREVVDRMGKINGIVDINRSLDLAKPEVRIHINRNKAADLGVDVRTIADTVGALMGGVDVTEFKRQGKSYDVRLRLLDKERTLPKDLDQIWIHTRSGATVDLASLATIETGVGPSAITRQDRQRAVFIFANLEEKKSLGEAKQEINKVLAEVVPEGYSYKYIAQSEVFGETLYYIAFAFALATVLTYMILAAQFESFIFPLSIMMGLPLSFIGAFGLLFVTGNSLNLLSMIGLILLIALPAKNGILLVDRTNQLRREGIPLREALVEAGSTRLRPILMTAVSAMAGVIPVALGFGVGSESRQAIGVAIAGGMLSSTLLTLVVVPVIYTYLDRFTQISIFAKIKKRVWAQAGEGK